MKNTFVKILLLSRVLSLSLAAAGISPDAANDSVQPDFMTEEEQLAAAIQRSLGGFANPIDDKAANGYTVRLSPYKADALGGNAMFCSGAEFSPSRLSELSQALFLSATKGDLEGVTYALQQGATFTTFGPNTTTPLIMAVKKGRTDTVNYLLERYRTLLEDCKRAGMFSTDAIKATGADINACDEHGRTALSYAVKNKNKMIIAALQSAGAKRMNLTKASSSASAVVMASSKAHGGAGWDPDFGPCLSSACATRTRPAWQVGDLNDGGLMAMAIAESMGQAFAPLPMHFKVQDDDQPIPRRRCPASSFDSDFAIGDASAAAFDWARVSQPSTSGRSIDPVRWEAGSLHPMRDPKELARISPDMALLSLGEQGHRGYVRSLVEEFGANLMAQNEAQETVLVLACKHGFTEVVQELVNFYMRLKNSPFLDIADQTGKTPLMHAVLIANEEIARVLVEAGVNVNLKDHDGWTALGLARGRKAYGGTVCDATIALLQSIGAKDH